MVGPVIGNAYAAKPERVAAYPNLDQVTVDHLLRTADLAGQTDNLNERRTTLQTDVTRSNTSQGKVWVEYTEAFIADATAEEKGPGLYAIAGRIALERTTTTTLDDSPTHDTEPFGRPLTLKIKPRRLINIIRNLRGKPHLYNAVAWSDPQADARWWDETVAQRLALNLSSHAN